MLLSIVIPAYNAEQFLSRAVESALLAGQQLSQEWEIIIVNNNSQDGTLTLMQQLRDQHPGLITLTTAAEQGPPAARNEGLRLTQGEWIQFLDADDRIFPGKLTEQLAAITSETDWVISGYRHLHPDGAVSDTLPHPDPWKGLVFGWRIGQTSANLYRRSALERVGNWDNRYASIDDPELHFRLLTDGAPYLIDAEVRSYYVHHDGERMTAGDMARPIQQLVELCAGVNTVLSQTRPEYWKKNAGYFCGALLRRIRTLATNDLPGAIVVYKKYFNPTSDCLCHPPYELVGRFTRLYPLLGFGRVEKSRLLLTNLLPRELKDKLKS